MNRWKREDATCKQRGNTGSLTGSNTIPISVVLQPQPLYYNAFSYESTTEAKV